MIACSQPQPTHTKTSTSRPSAGFVSSTALSRSSPPQCWHCVVAGGSMIGRMTRSNRPSWALSSAICMLFVLVQWSSDGAGAWSRLCARPSSAARRGLSRRTFCMPRDVAQALVQRQACGAAHAQRFCMSRRGDDVTAFEHRAPRAAHHDLAQRRQRRFRADHLYASVAICFVCAAEYRPQPGRLSSVSF